MYCKLKYILYFSLCFLLMWTLLGVTGHNTDYIKYIRFLTPISISMLLCRKRQIPSGDNDNYMFFRNMLLLYLFVALVTCLSNILFFSQGFTYRNFVNLILLLSPVYFFYILSICNRDKKEINNLIMFLFCSYIIMTVFILWQRDLSVRQIIKSVTSNVIVDTFDRDTENAISWSFVFFCLYFLYVTKYKLFFISLIFVFLGGKRIAIGGLAVSITVFFLLNHSFSLRKIIRKNGFKIFVVLFLLFVGQLWVDIYSGKYDDLITDITGVDAYLFFTGRIEIFAMFFNHNPDESNYFLGYGLGYIENVLYYKAFFPAPLCNDFIRLYMELGGVLFVAWCLIMTKHTSKNHVAFASFVLLLFLMQTDNALMYECIMYPFYLTVSYSLLDYREKNTNKEKVNIGFINN